MADVPEHHSSEDMMEVSGIPRKRSKRVVQESASSPRQHPPRPSETETTECSASAETTLVEPVSGAASTPVIDLSDDPGSVPCSVFVQQITDQNRAGRSQNSDGRGNYGAGSGSSGIGTSSSGSSSISPGAPFHLRSMRCLAGPCLADISSRCLEVALPGTVVLIYGLARDHSFNGSIGVLQGTGPKWIKMDFRERNCRDFVRTAPDNFIVLLHVPVSGQDIVSAPRKHLFLWPERPQPVADPSADDPGIGPRGRPARAAAVVARRAMRAVLVL
eukprot:gnl/TRDRNA2_/TRDRNA2_177854_c9_seq17.p1 gnl/TRDRNA2_/TRDRNA2_177854_c9~~gnl/TRDRNA2_/TRDRNA2_177854_c9_seq17.p1  ORF type:complete len:300 (+),score=21.19 gnl/TRDRNA2_/TRDRNA2_177854_c9_seq17:79-900(+)